jgi:hypothetical protein
VLSTSVVPFKHSISSFDWINFFKDFPGIKYKIENQKLFLEEISPDSLALLKDFFGKFKFPFEIQDNFNGLIFEKTIILPTMSDELFFTFIQFYYLYNTVIDYEIYRKFFNVLVTEIASHIRIISSKSHPLRIIIEALKRESDFESIIPHFDILKQINNWNNLFTQKSLSVPHKKLSINTWLHILRHPTEAKDNLQVFLEILDTKYIYTSIPLIDPKGSELFSLTILNEEYGSVEKSKVSSEESSEKSPEESSEESTEILSYWLTLGSLILRNISYALIRLNQLSFEGFSQQDIEFFGYFKSKLTLFSESCLNKDLIDAYKQYESPRSKMVSYIRGHDLYTYNRSTILEFHLKQAQAEFKRFPDKKIVRKRVNRRSTRLYTFLNDILYLYKDYLIEIPNLTKASGKYTDVAKILREDKFFNN